MVTVRLIEEEDAGAEHPHSFGRMAAFHGQMGMFTRALAYILSHGADGLAQRGRRCSAQCQLRAAQP
jgi:glycine dehydrogenase subunit 2